jgi:glycosyltransferase involved in cell wall biosynthesis
MNVTPELVESLRMLLSQQSVADASPNPSVGDRTPNRTSGDRPVMLFAPWCYGHHPTYLRYLIQYQLAQEKLAQGKLAQVGRRSLKIVVSADFLRAHADVWQLAQPESGIEFVPMDWAEEMPLREASGLQRGQIQADLMAKYAKRLQAREVLIMYFDSCQLPFVLGYKLPCPFSVIYFRVTFHYPAEPQASLRQSARTQLQSLRERSCLQWILRHPQLNTLFCLDPMAIAPINKLRFRRQPKAVHLPDPVDVQTVNYSAEQIRLGKARLGIDPRRKVLLSFGRLAEARKGIPQLLAAIAQLPNDLCQQLTLLFVGEPDEAGMQQLEDWLQPIRQNHPVQITTQYGYVPESEVGFYFQLADAVLAPYQKHVGMSGILLLAAAAHKPVLSSNYGLMGELVRQYQLGVAVDSTQPTELAKGLTQLCDRYLMAGEGDRSNPLSCLEAIKQMDQFVQQNSSEQFAQTIFKHLTF